MGVYQDNPKIRKYEDAAIKAYEKGQMAKGRKYEKMADKLYANQWNKAMGVK